MNPCFTLEHKAADIAALATEWDSMVCEAPEGFSGLDATAGSVWFEALCTAFAQAASPVVLVARDEAGRLVGLLPLVRLSRGRLGDTLGPPTELHGGRCGPLLDPQHAEALLPRLLLATAQWVPAWSKLQLTLPEGDHLQQVRNACHQLNWPWHARDAGETCGFALPERASELSATMPAKLRQNLRTAANRLAKRHHSVEVREFSGEEQAAELLNSMLVIERGSWKHEAGSAITRHPQQQAFYAALFPRALRAGQLLGLTMVLDGQAVAYVVGIVHDGVYCCLKHSQLTSHDAFSPSGLLMHELLERLVRRQVRRFDWMGLTEEHKLRWSSNNILYRRQTLWLFNPGWRGRVQALRDKALRWFVRGQEVPPIKRGRPQPLSDTKPAAAAILRSSGTFREPSGLAGGTS